MGPAGFNRCLGTLHLRKKSPKHYVSPGKYLLVSRIVNVTDFPSTSEPFRWPELPVTVTDNKLPVRKPKEKFLSFLMLVLYLGPLVIAAALIEPLVTNELLRKSIVFCVFFFGGLSVVVLFSSLPALVANFYQKRQLKQAENLCHLYLFTVGNFSPYSLEKALMQGLLAEVLRAEGRFDEAEKEIRAGIITCLLNEQVGKVSPEQIKSEQIRKALEASVDLNMPTKGMLYESFGAILRDKKMYKEAIEAGKISLKIIADKINLYQIKQSSSFEPKSSESSRNKQIQLALASAQYELALSYLADQNHEHALTLLKNARKLREEHTSSIHYLANVLSALSRAYLADEEKEKARKTAQEALDLLKETKFPVEQLAKARALHTLGLVYRSMDKPEAAKNLTLEASEIRLKWLAPGDPEMDGSPTY